MVLWSSQKLNADTERNDKNLRSTCLSYKRIKNEKGEQDTLMGFDLRPYSEINEPQTSVHVHVGPL
jgi:hypothetical protein